MDQEQAQVAVHIIVHGDVQGVGFRYFVQRYAQSLSIVGWVRNRDEGTVEVWAEGLRLSLDDLVRQVNHGPRPGLVRRLEVKWYAAEGTFRNFYIRW